MNNKGRIAISEIIVLLIGTIAFAYLAGGGIGFVSAAEKKEDKTNKDFISWLGIGSTIYSKGSTDKSSSKTTPTSGEESGWKLENLWKTGEAQEQWEKTFSAPAQEAYDSAEKLYGDMTAAEKAAAEAYKEHAKYRDKFLETENPTEELADLTTETSDKYNEAYKKSKEAKKEAEIAKKEFAKKRAAAKAAEPSKTYRVGEALVSSVSYGLLAYGVSYGVLSMFGADRKWLQSVPPALGLGVFAGKFTYELIEIFGENSELLGVGAGYWGAGVGIVVFAITFAETFKEEKFKLTTYNCNAWQAPVGGEYCHLCNEQDLPCSEYQCKSLGQACELLNDEETGDQFCTWVNENDVTPPIIKVRIDSLKENYTFTPDDVIAPPNAGVWVEYLGNKNKSDKCIPAFTPLTFGITTVDKHETIFGKERDEPAICRVDIVRKSFGEMEYSFEEPEKYRINHTFTISLPSIEALEQDNLTLENDGEFEIYTKCMDANGNENMNDFVFKFCVQKGPDNEVPYVVGTNIINGMPIKSGQEKINFTMYMNEPVNCKWSIQDQDYTSMTQQMNCSEGYSQYNQQMVWICEATLAGIKDKQENKFYFRCEDKAETKNVNSQDLFYDEGGFVILGTQPLVIDEAGPSGIIRDSAIEVKTGLTAKTSAGFNEGEATCYYREVGEQGSFIEFYDTRSYQHLTYLNLVEGDYEYTIKCIDLGGNEDTQQINFTVESDSEAPEVVRAYKEETFLKIVTDELAECVYDTKSSNFLFEDGVPMTKSSDGKSHFVDWNPREKFYIKCRDEYGNEPAPDEANIIIKPLE